MSDYMNFNRRALLKSAAAIAASTTLPKWFVEETRANAPEKSAGQRPRIALIGCGGQGRGDAKKASRFGDVVMVCDVDDERIAEAKKLWPEAITKKDFRHVTESREVDVVICGTVDHWHTLVSIAAM